jgi:hypothetical protein
MAFAGDAEISVNSCKIYAQMWLCSQRHISNPMRGVSYKIITYIGLTASLEEKTFPIPM